MNGSRLSPTRQSGLTSPLVSPLVTTKVEEVGSDASSFDSKYQYERGRQKLQKIMQKNNAVVEFQQAAKDRWRVQKDKQLCFTSITTLVLMVTQNILVWQMANSAQPAEDGLRVEQDKHPVLYIIVWGLYAVMAVLTLFALFILFTYYSTLYRLKRSQLMQALTDSRDVNPENAKHLSSKAQFFRPLYSRFLGEVLVQLIFPYPIIDRGTIFYQFLLIGMFARLYILARLLHTSSRAFRRRNQIRSQYQDFRRMNLKISWSLTIKMAFYKYMWAMVSVFTVLVLLALSFCLYVVERGTIDNEAFGDLGNCLWFAYVTFTTIGFGDMVPKTVSGRVVTVFIGICGQVIISAFGGVVTNKLAPTKTQQLVTEYLENQDAELAYKNAAVQLIQSVWRARRSRLRAKMMSAVNKNNSSKKNTSSPSNLSINGNSRGGAASAIGSKVRPGNSGKVKTSRSRELVYAAVKRFRSKRYQLAKSSLQAIDPVIDQKLDVISQSIEDHGDALTRILAHLDGITSPLSLGGQGSGGVGGSGGPHKKRDGAQLFSFAFTSPGSTNGKSSPPITAGRRRTASMLGAASGPMHRRQPGPMQLSRMRSSSITGKQQFSPLFGRVSPGRRLSYLEHAGSAPLRRRRSDASDYSACSHAPQIRIGTVSSVSNDDPEDASKRSLGGPSAQTVRKDVYCRSPDAQPAPPPTLPNQALLQQQGSTLLQQQQQHGSGGDSDPSVDAATDDRATEAADEPEPKQRNTFNRTVPVASLLASGKLDRKERERAMRGRKSPLVFDDRRPADPPQQPVPRRQLAADDAGELAAANGSVATLCSQGSSSGSESTAEGLLEPATPFIPSGAAEASPGSILKKRRGYGAGSGHKLATGQHPTPHFNQPAPGGAGRGGPIVVLDETSSDEDAQHPRRSAKRKPAFVEPLAKPAATLSQGRRREPPASAANPPAHANNATPAATSTAAVGNKTASAAAARGQKRARDEFFSSGSFEGLLGTAKQRGTVFDRDSDDDIVAHVPPQAQKKGGYYYYDDTTPCKTAFTAKPYERLVSPQATKVDGPGFKGTPAGSNPLLADAAGSSVNSKERLFVNESSFGVDVLPRPGEVALDVDDSDAGPAPGRRHRKNGSSKDSPGYINLDISLADL
ncbi:Small conductance calcium-activated potassium channel-like protein 3 [Diplonema papillatum]|nr:Small conductance calcium-activated potassium channel-like protein 3 [Diplonema papillatum]